MTDKIEILNTAIANGEVSIKDFYWLSGFRTRISELNRDYGLFNKRIAIDKNRYNRPFNYTVHVLTDKDMAKAALQQEKEKNNIK
jgi:hypothetical protein